MSTKITDVFFVSRFVLFVCLVAPRLGDRANEEASDAIWRFERPNPNCDAFSRMVGDVDGSGQIIATSHDLTPNGGLVREVPLFQGNPGW